MLVDHKFAEIISLDNLLAAWQEFVVGKRGRLDVQVFAGRLMDNIYDLHYDLVERKYQHGAYQDFKISDPKPRHIHKARVRDRLLHHAIYRQLYPYFDSLFVSDSFSCRLGKGTHKALARFETFSRQISKNNSRTAWTLKGDIKKFFASIDHKILIAILRLRVGDGDLLELLKNIIGSFHDEVTGQGLPLGNLTSQLFANIYLNEFDRFVKHGLKARYYIRYADDFVILADQRAELIELVPLLQKFLLERLKLVLHPDKLFIKTVASGVDFLGWVHFPKHRVMRRATKLRMMRKLATNQKEATRNSYLGLIKHGNTYKLRASLFGEY